MFLYKCTQRSLIRKRFRMNERKNYNFKMKYCEIFSELLKMYNIYSIIVSIRKIIA